MKKKSFKMILSSILIFIISFSLTACSQNNASKTKVKEVKVNEVARSIFYAPMYVAINEGFFEKEGLKIELSTGQGADATYSKKQIKKATNYGGFFYGLQTLQGVYPWV